MLIILRHAEPRQTELDPELTSFGHRMAGEAGDWVAGILAAMPEVQLLHTPTNRTQQTATAIQIRLGDGASIASIPQLPESLQDLDVLVDRLSNRHPELPAPPLPPTVLVGHHTTLVGLARDLQLEPSVLNPRNLAAGLALVRDSTRPHGWRVVAHWPGRPG